MADAKINARAVQADVSSATAELEGLSPDVVESALSQALPLPDIMMGGAVLVLVIMFHAFWIRNITSLFMRRSGFVRLRASQWRADILLMATVFALLVLHLAEVVLWSAALVWGGIVRDWSTAAYFAANCYTALGEPFSLPRQWRMVAPILAMSGIFSFAWTASVLVNFVARYNALRAAILRSTQPGEDDRSQAR